MRVFRLALLALLIPALSKGQVSENDSIPEDVLIIAGDDPILSMMDSLMTSRFFSHYCFSTDLELLNVHGYSEDSVPSFSTDIYRRRLELLDRETPMELSYNETVQGFINLYAVRRKDLTGRVLGLSRLYFPMIEEALDRHDIPLEMKYLAIVESALNPTAKSRAGAVGLWQFMYATGKMFGLESTSYTDERMDPYLATEAACRYLKYLYAMYDDWNLALAAYNSGPGNVNKAIRRSGGKRDFWEIKPFLPKETQGYVPAFIAVNYVMNYATEHNIYPEACLYSFFECDTLHVSGKLRFDQLSAFTGLSLEDLAYLNPVFRKGVVPDNGKKHALVLPVDKVGIFLANQDSIYSYKLDQEPEPEEEPVAESISYKVRSGDVLGSIARRHGVSVSEIQRWNNLRGTRIYPGQRLVIYTSKRGSS